MQSVIFTTNSARLFNTDQAPAGILKWPNVAINPDLARVEGVLPQFWKLEDGFIVAMTPKEIRHRKRVIEKNGIDNYVRKLELFEIRPEIKDYEIIKALEKEYNQLRIINYFYVGAQVLTVILLIVVLFKK